MHYFMSKRDQHQQHTPDAFTRHTHLDTNTPSLATVPSDIQVPPINDMSLHDYTISTRQNDPLTFHSSFAPLAPTICQAPPKPRENNTFILHDNRINFQDNPIQNPARPAGTSKTHEHDTPSTPICAASNCDSPASLRCTRCKCTQYCSRTCRASQWRSHKATCHGTLMT